MKIKIEKAGKEKREVIQNLSSFYTYEMSRHCGWKTPEDGQFQCFNLGHYWGDSKRHPFLIRVDDELAGFVLLHNYGMTSDVDWVVGEFFIVAKYQQKGIGKEAAYQLFKQFPGKWEIMQIPENKPAIAFWEKIVKSYTGGKYQKSEVVVQEPEPHPMIALYFDSDS